MATARCTGLGRCCTEAALSFDETACRRVSAAAIESLAGLPDVVFDAEAAAACAAIVEPAPDRCGAQGFEEDPCPLVLRGTRPLGADCESGVQCAPVEDVAAECLRKADGEGLACQPFSGPRRAGRGEACGSTCDGLGCSFGPDPSCDATRGLQCAPSQTCEPLVAEGGACSLGVSRGEDRSCQPGTYCDGRACVPQLEAGASCRACDGDSCTRDHRACRDPLACIDPGFAGDPRCAPRLPIGAVCSPEAIGRDCESRTCQRVCDSFPCASAPWRCVPPVDGDECSFAGASVSTGGLVTEAFPAAQKPR